MTRLRRRRSGMYDVRVPPPPSGPPTFFAAESVCGNLWRYAGQQYVDDVDSSACLDETYVDAEYVPAQSWVGEGGEASVEEGECILSVSPGSVLPVEIHRARLSGQEYFVDSGRAASPVAYHGGFLWWVEVLQAGGLSFSLYRSRPDLSEAAVVGSVTITDPSGGGDLHWVGKDPGPAIAAGPAAVLSEWLWALTSPASPAVGGVRLRFPVGGGSPEWAALSGAALTFARAVAAPEGGFLSADGTQVRHSGGSTAIGLTWQTEYYSAGSPASTVAAERLSLGAGGVLAIFGDLTAGRGFAVAPTGGPFETGPSATLYDLLPNPDDDPVGVGWIRGNP